MTGNTENSIVLKLSGSIDADNCESVKQELMSELEGKDPDIVILDADKLSYISNAGLRMLLQIMNTYPNISMVNVEPDVYETLETTGFTEMMTIEKAIREISIEGCEVIGEGEDGIVYRVDRETVVKIYKNADALPEIRNEQKIARMALILGVPTAISYDVVRAGDKYGAVFELLNARSFSKILAEQPEKMDWCVQEYIDLLKRIHSIEVPEGKLPSYNPTVQGWIRRARSFLPPEQGQRLQDMIEAIPDRGTMIHGDYHTKNIVLSGEEVLLVDMDTLSTGHPIFELAQMYCSFIGFYETEQRQIMDYQGFDADTGRTFWRKSLRAYLETEDEEAIARAENIIRCVAYVKLIDWSIRHYQPDDEDGLHEREYWRQELTELLDRSNAAHPEEDIRVWRIKKVRARTEEPLSVFVSILNSGRARKTDLHMHTSVSDGTDTPKEILAYVRDAGIPLFSITDHDSVEANRIIRSIPWEGEPHYITGAEFSCKDENGLYHI